MTLRFFSLLALCALSLFTITTRAGAQITPPGLGNAQSAAWLAVGLRQNLDAIERRQSMTYVGVGSVSGRNDGNPFRNPDIIVLNEEFSDQFHKHWLYALALSYRRQNFYETDSPRASDAWAYKRTQELRTYGRYSFIERTERTKLVLTFTPEIRGFLAPDFSPLDQLVQFRFRFRGQLSVNLDKAAVHRLLGSAEALNSISRERGGWNELAYRESRFCFYYSLRSKQLPFVVDVGYMNNLLGKGNTKVDVHYVALDLVWENPFGKPQREKARPVEYLQ